MRGPESPVELLSPPPGEEAMGEIEFQWQAAPDAFEYVFEVLDLEGESLFTHTSDETSYRMDLDQHPELEGNLLWWVRVRLLDGTESNSPTRPFQVPRRQDRR
jgi:hypothetical protein